MEPNTQKVTNMLEACSSGKLHVVETLLKENPIYASQQDMETGASPLMAAANAGNLALCQYLLEAGAPWNAVDRQGQCAGNYATTAEHWAIVNLLVEWGTRAELILGAIERTSRDNDGNNILTSVVPNAPAEQEPSSLTRCRQRCCHDGMGTAIDESTCSGFDGRTRKTSYEYWFRYGNHRFSIAGFAARVAHYCRGASRRVQTYARVGMGQETQRSHLFWKMARLLAEADSRRCPDGWRLLRYSKWHFELHLEQHEYQLTTHFLVVKSTANIFWTWKIFMDKWFNF